MNLPFDPSTVEIIKLPDGTELDPRQSLAIRLRTMDDLTYDEIAQRSGYSSGTAVQQFMATKRAQEAVRVALIQHLNEGARIGLKTMIDLAKKAKSENVRQLAAADLLNRAQVKLNDTQDARARENFSININLGEGVQLRDITPKEGGEGEN